MLNGSLSDGRQQHTRGLASLLIRVRRKHSRHTRHRRASVAGTAEALEDRALLASVIVGDAALDIAEGADIGGIDASHLIIPDSIRNAPRDQAQGEPLHAGAQNPLTIILDFNDPGQPNTMDMFGNEITSLDVTAYGFTQAEYDNVTQAVLAEVENHYLGIPTSDVFAQSPIPPGFELEVDFEIGDIGTPPANGSNDYYYVQIGTAVSGPCAIPGVLGCNGLEAIRTLAGGPGNPGAPAGTVTGSVFSDVIQTLGNITPSNALTSGDLTFTARAIGGTTSHEAGHGISLLHIDFAGVLTPNGFGPVMGTGAIDLPNQQRIEPREFSIMGTNAQAGGATQFHVQQLVNAIGLRSTLVPLTAQITPTEIREDAGMGAATMVVSRGGDTSVPLDVTVTLSDTTEIRIVDQFGNVVLSGNTITIPAGQDQVVLGIDALDDAILDGTQTVNITIAAVGSNPFTSSIDVTDHETLTLTVNPPDQIAENAGPAATTATLTRSNTTTEASSNLLVTQNNTVFEYTAAGVQLNQIDVPYGGQVPVPQRLFAASQGGASTNGILELDPATGLVINQFAPPTLITTSNGLAYDGNSLWYLSGQELYELDPNSGSVKGQQTLPGNPGNLDGLAFLNGELFIGDWMNEDILVLDPAANIITRTLDLDSLLPGIDLSTGSVGIAGLTTGGGAGLVVSANFTGSATQQILIVDPTSGATQTRFSAGAGVVNGLAVLNGQIYVGFDNTISNHVIVYDPAGTELNRFTVTGSVRIIDLGGDDGADGFRPPAEVVRDVVVTPGGDIAVIDGTNDVYVERLPTGETDWVNLTASGLSVANVPHVGGIAAFENFIYATDMNTGIPDESRGIIRFDITDGSSEQFAPVQDFVDVTLGLDGLLYGLDPNGLTVTAFDPNTMAIQTSVNLGASVRAITVNELGLLFGVTAGGVVYRFSQTGVIGGAMTLQTTGLLDIDGDGRGGLVIGSEMGEIIQTDEAFSGSTSFFAPTLGRAAFVSYATPITPGGPLPQLVVPIENSDPTEVNVPATVVIPAGQQSVTFDVDAVDDFIIDGTQTVTLTAEAPGYTVSGADIVQVLDVESLSVNVVADQIIESDGPNATQVIVSRSNINGPYSRFEDQQYSNNTRQFIIDNSTIVSAIEVPAQNAAVNDINVTVDITHDWIGDLNLFLVSPSGTRLELFSSVGNNGTQFRNTVLDDEAAVPIDSGSSPFTGTFRPQNPLSTFDGEQIAGLWRLEVQDASRRDTGVLNSWGIDFTAVGLAPLVVQLSSSDPSEASVPTTVVIPANQSQVTVGVDAVDDTLLDGPQTAVIVATSFGSGLTDANDALLVQDDEALTLTVSTNTVSEDAGVNAIIGTVRRNNTDTSFPLTVTLASSDTTELTVPPVVVIPIGTSLATFSIDAVDDSVLDGTQTVTITASNPQYAAPVTQDIDVLDREAKLEINLAQTTVSENGTVVLGTVSRKDASTLNDVVVVSLTVLDDQGFPDATEATVPSTLLIPSGATSAQLTVTIVDDTLLDGTQTVTIQATAVDLEPGLANLDVTDHETLTVDIAPGSLHENDGDMTLATATVTRSNNDIGLPLTVDLANSDNTEAEIVRFDIQNNLQVISAVTIPAAAKSTTFFIRAVDDLDIDFTQNVDITASAAGYMDGVGSIDILDHEPPILTGPIGRTRDARPVITWTELAGASRYDVWMNNRSTGESQVLRDANVIGTTYVSPIPLPIGEYRVWVRAFDSLERAGVWSDALTFRVTTPPTMTAPVGAADTLRPEITFTNVTESDHYELWVNQLETPNAPARGRIINELMLTETSYTPLIDLGPGRYRAWTRAFRATNRVDALNNTVYDAGDWSVPITFSVLMPPVLLSPAEATFDRTPSITWTESESADHYDIWVRDLTNGVDQIIRDQFVRGTEFIPDTDLGDGTYRVWVRAVTEDLTRSKWSRGRTFRVGGPPRLTGPQDGSNVLPTFAWTAVDDAERYDLWVNQVGGQQQIIREENLTGTSFTAVTALTPGTYRVWVRAISNMGEVSRWSKMLEFEITIVADTGNAPEAFGTLASALPSALQSDVQQNRQDDSDQTEEARRETAEADQVQVASVSVAEMQSESNRSNRTSDQRVAAVSDRRVDALDSVMSRWAVSDWWVVGLVDENRG